MMMGLKEDQEKMSKSIEDSAIFMEDTAVGGRCYSGLHIDALVAPACAVVLLPRECVCACASVNVCHMPGASYLW